MKLMHQFFKVRTLCISLLALFVCTGSALAQSSQPDPSALTGDASVTINVLWLLVATCLILLMQPGFALLTTGFTRAKNVSNTMGMGLMVFAITALCYWAVGFAFQFGGINQPIPGAGGDAWTFMPTTLGDWGSNLNRELSFGSHGILGLSGFLLSDIVNNFGILAFFFLHFAIAAVAVAIPAGAMAERMKWSGYLILTIVMGLLVYPLIGNWGWGGGWLANLGRSMQLGNGMVDYAGGGVVHLTGGAVALAGALVIGPRIGKYNRDGSANVIAGHNVPMAILGAFLLVVGWLGLNAAAALGFSGALRGLTLQAIVNTLLAISAGALSAMFYMTIISRLRRPDPVMTVKGLMGGAVAISACGALVAPWAAVVIGLLAGIFVCAAAAALDRLKIDDAVGAIPVHLVGGGWGLLAVGIFANGNPASANWNGVASTVSGLLAANGGGQGGVSQLLVQLLALLVIFVVPFGISFVIFKAMHAAGVMRVSPDVELAGLDVVEMGAEGYPADFEPSVESLRSMTYP